ncbi:hydrogenase [Lysobacter sp. HDW10]|uniref:3-hydroxybutyrate oligomer hydrolase family protein n=1 Tax=Lysobacter sp. HDW10 TaxID=2714936 RepID=UPI0014079DE1|nr:3-hydroxybutyrate oligomer hydrolase family protein [Lysobacter sp. HDW10]QIK80845.1 hydrogenase [Lysobacter sp. HDW10]
MKILMPVAAAVFVSACAMTGAHPKEPAMSAPVTVSEHRQGDDLLTAGLGLAGLREMAAPKFVDPEHPTAAERRRRAIWANWRGIADLSMQGGYGSVYGSVADIPGREFSTLMTVPGAQHPHRVLLQLPDNFDAGKRCLVVAAASGSRGVYGAISLASAWGLPRGCAVVHTDKAAGSDLFDIDANEGVDALGARVSAARATAFAPRVAEGAKGIAFKHAHSEDNPEADWGRHVKQAAAFALQQLNEALPNQAPFTFENTRIIATGISNGGGAVLRAAEMDGDWLDGVVAGEPNVYVEGARPLYDFATEAAVFMPCALLDLPADALPQPPVRAQVEPLWTQRCASLKAQGLIEGDTVAKQAASAHAHLRASGWDDISLAAGAASTGFDLWRSVAAAYASAYGRYRAGEHPCGYSYTAMTAQLQPRASTAAERNTWWSESAGIPPGNGILLHDPRMVPPDFSLAGEQCLRALWTDDNEDAKRVRAGIEATRAKMPRRGLPVLVIHGEEDGLVPPVFSSAPYVAAARAAGRPVGYWKVGKAEHFDAFLAFPSYAARFVPLMPYMYAGLDRMWSTIESKATLDGDVRIDAQPRGTGAVTATDLKLPN